MIAELDEVSEHLNADHPDTVALVARFCADGRVGRTEPIEAAIRSVDGRGVAVTLIRADHGGEQIGARRDFATTCSTVDEVRAELFGMLVAARDWIGADQPLTSLERELAGAGSTTFLTEVVAITEVTPTLRQITFGGGLDDFEPLGGDQFLYVLLPPAGRSTLTVGPDFSWNAYELMPQADRPVGAYYTVRSWRPNQRQLDMWFVLHGHEGASSAWASRAAIGQPAALWGPRRSFEPPAGTGSYLLVVDETGFGAVCAVLDELLATDPQVVAWVIAEHDGAFGRVEIPIGPNVDVTWLDREGRHPGATSLLADCVRDVDSAVGVPSDVYAFGAGESGAITQVRRYLRTSVGLDAGQVRMTGYWRRSHDERTPLGSAGV